MEGNCCCDWKCLALDFRKCNCSFKKRSFWIFFLPLTPRLSIFYSGGNANADTSGVCAITPDWVCILTQKEGNKPSCIRIWIRISKRCKAKVGLVLKQNLTRNSFLVCFSCTKKREVFFCSVKLEVCARVCNWLSHMAPASESWFALVHVIHNNKHNHAGVLSLCVMLDKHNFCGFLLPQPDKLACENLGRSEIV